MRRRDANCPGPVIDFQDCNKHPCPVDCIWGNWSAWSSCDATCGGGKQSRTRPERTEAAFGGKQCIGSSKETRDCGLTPCPVDCEWTEWSLWSNCSKDCGGGSKERARDVKVKAENSGRECTGDAQEQDACNAQPCPVDCAWEEWAAWSDCTVTCGNGTTQRGRAIAVQQVGTGKPCEGEALETDFCNTDPCAVNCKWDGWAAWSTCTKTCGGGLRVRARVKLQDAQFGGEDCSGNASEQGDCSSNLCPVDCVWEEWGAWGGCSKSCGDGSKRRTRGQKSAEGGGKPCIGPDTESQKCGEPCKAQAHK